MEKNKGAIPGKTGSKARPLLDPTPKLSDLGVTKTQSSRWQKLAANARIGQEIAAIPKASGPGRGKKHLPGQVNVSGRGAIAIPGTPRSRLQKLAAIPAPCAPLPSRSCTRMNRRSERKFR